MAESMFEPAGVLAQRLGESVQLTVKILELAAVSDQCLEPGPAPENNSELAAALKQRLELVIVVESRVAVAAREDEVVV